MDISEFINLIVNNYFSVAVATYLGIHVEKQINSLSSSITELNTIISSKLGVALDVDFENNSNKASCLKAISIFSTYRL